MTKDDPNSDMEAKWGTSDYVDGPSREIGRGDSRIRLHLGRKAAMAGATEQREMQTAAVMEVVGYLGAAAASVAEMEAAAMTVAANRSRSPSVRSSPSPKPMPMHTPLPPPEPMPMPLGGVESPIPESPIPESPIPKADSDRGHNGGADAAGADEDPVGRTDGQGT